MFDPAMICNLCGGRATDKRRSIILSLGCGFYGLAHTIVYLKQDFTCKYRLTCFNAASETFGRKIK